MGDNRSMEPQLAVAHLDHVHLRRAVELASAARQGGNHPFGALVVLADGTVIDAMNSVVSDGDPTAHAEMNVVRRASTSLSFEQLSTATLFSSTEPCAMCAGAIYWSGISRVVFALAATELDAIVNAEGSSEPTLDLPCAEVLARGGRRIDVVGPVETLGAAEVHVGFWSQL